MKDLTNFLNKKTNKTFILNEIFVCCLLTVCCLAQPYADSVRERMEKEITSIESLQIFYQNHTAPYERRYTLQYIPEYLKKFGVTETPAWVITAFDSALGSPYAPLAVAATRSIGELNLAQFAGKLATSFAAAPGKNPASQYSVRFAVLESMQRFDSTTVQQQLPALVDNYSEELIFSQVFEKLMDVVVNYGQPAAMGKKVNRFETFAVKALTQHEEEIKSSGKAIDKENDPFYPEFNRVMQVINRVKMSMAHKGGSHE